MIKVILAVLALLGAQKQSGYVVEKTIEGGAEYNDYYIVNLGGELYEVEADDLEEGDTVTCYFIGDETVLTLYGER
jgi:hypothetical protein